MVRSRARLAAAHQLDCAPSIYPCPSLLSVCRFGDWTRDEFVALMLPKRDRMLQRAAQRTQQEGKAPVGEGQQGRQGQVVQAAMQAGVSSGEDEPLQKHQLPYEPVTPLDRLPESVSWRGAFPVQDQANCGSW